MKATPAFQFYPADFLVGTADMTNEETGIYIRLLSLQWAKGRLDTSKVSRLVGTEIPPAVMEKFQVADGRMWNVRLETERDKQAKYREDQSKKGKAGADARWNGNGHAPANGRTMAATKSRPSSGQSQNDDSSSLSSSSDFNLQTSSSKEAQSAAVAAARVKGRADSSIADPQLLDWLRWWNSLKAASLVEAGANESQPSQGVRKAWTQAKADTELSESLRDRGAIEREIRASSFCRGGWFRLEKLLAGVNSDGELIVKKLLDGAYRDRKGEHHGKPTDQRVGSNAGTSQRDNHADYIRRKGLDRQADNSTTEVAAERP